MTMTETRPVVHVPATGEHRDAPARKKRTSRRIALPVLFAIAGAALPFTLASPPASAATPTCTATSESPHFSQGAGGVIVKGRTICSNSMPSVRLGVYLFKCPKAPPAGTAQGCTRVADGVRTIPNPKNGMTYTEYAPKDGPGLKGPSWWVGCTQVLGYDNRGSQSFGKEHFSNPVYR